MQTTLPPLGTQLITYPDSLGGDLAALDRLLSTELRGLFPGGVHVLPPFPSSGDRGFAPITYREIEPAFGTWSDLERVGSHGGLLLDIMVNHISRQSGIFVDFEARGRDSPWADVMLTLDKIWPGGTPDPDDVAKVFLRKPEHPSSDVHIAATGQTERIWTSFGPRADWSEQIDLDIHSPLTWELYDEWFELLATHGATMVRLDALGYVTKRAGTACFMVEPEIWAFLDRITEVAAHHGLRVLPEVHDTRPTFDALTRRGHAAYNFSLPGLILEALISGQSDALDVELRNAPEQQVTLLDCHDGIPIQPDLTGLLPQSRLQGLVDACLERGANLNRILGAPAGSFDAHQINITYADACGSDDGYVLARAIQLFAPGTPQIYYVGLLAGSGDLAAVAESGEGRAVNRRNYSEDEVRSALQRPVVSRLIELIELRNSHPAFSGECRVHPAGESRVAIEWVADTSFCRLDADLVAHDLSVTAS